MRAALSLATLLLIGCEQVDSNRTASLDDPARPAPATVDSARPGTPVPDATTTRIPAPSPRADVTPGAAGVRPDNTAVNERDQNSAAKTPLDQGENEADRKTTADIRQRIVNAENMSINARNVKIITAGGKVTLRGPVNSAAERESIVRFAREVAGEANVQDQLEVAAANP